MKETNHLIPFDIEKAKAGTTVVTRAGLPVRILCYDFDGVMADRVIFGLVKDGFESCYAWYLTGKRYKDCESHRDLFHPAPEMWVNLGIDEKNGRISHVFDTIFISKEGAKRQACRGLNLKQYRLVEE